MNILLAFERWIFWLYKYSSTIKSIEKSNGTSILLILSILSISSLIAESYYVTLDNKLKDSITVTASTDEYGFNKDGINTDTGTNYDSEGYDANGFHKDTGIHRETGTEYDPEGYDHQGFGVGTCVYNDSNRIYLGWSGTNHFYDSGILIQSTTLNSITYNGIYYYTDGTNKARSGDGYYWLYCS